MPTGSDYSLELDPLSHKVIPSESKYEVLSTKIEIQLKKEVFAIKWGALEGDDANAGSMAAVSGELLHKKKREIFCNLPKLAFGLRSVLTLPIPHVLIDIIFCRCCCTSIPNIVQEAQELGCSG